MVATPFNVRYMFFCPIRAEIWQSRSPESRRKARHCWHTGPSHDRPRTTPSHRRDKTMTQKMNRLASKQWAEEQGRKRQEEIAQQNVEHDLALLREIRRTVMFKLKGTATNDALLEALRNHAERLTGDQDAINTPRHSIP